MDDQRKQAIWNATFAAAFVADIENLYRASWSTPGTGKARCDLAQDHDYSCAEAAVVIADAAVKGIEKLEAEDEELALGWDRVHSKTQVDDSSSS